MTDEQKRDLDDVLNATIHLARVTSEFLDGRLTLKHLREASLTAEEHEAVERLWQAVN